MKQQNKSYDSAYPVAFLLWTHFSSNTTANMYVKCCMRYVSSRMEQLKIVMTIIRTCIQNYDIQTHMFRKNMKIILLSVCSMHKYCNLSRPCTACDAWLPEPGPEVDSVPSDTPISGESGELMAQTRCVFYIGGFGQNDCSWEQIPKAGVCIILEVRLILETRRYSPWNLLHEPDKCCDFRWPNDRRHPSFPTGARKSVTTDRCRDHRSTSWGASSLDYLEELWKIAKCRASIWHLSTLRQIGKL